MDEAAGLVAEEDIDLLGFDDGCYFAVAKLVVGHSLAFAVFATAIVWRSAFAASASDRGFYTSCKGTGRLARLAGRLGHLALFGY